MPTVNNHDVAGIARRINRFIDELQKSVSSESSQINAYDLERSRTYLKAVEEYHNWVMSQPQLDLPETHPRQINVEDGPALVSVENESLTDLVYMLALTRDEVLNGQSARQGSGLVIFDSNRLMAIVQKMNAFLETYVSEVTPLDLPESSPMRSGAQDGRAGI
jgi:hypothetical protein